MENKSTIDNVIDLVQACGYALDDQKREAIGKAVDTWLSQNPIHFVRDRNNGITTLTFEESTTHKRFSYEEDGAENIYARFIDHHNKLTGRITDEKLFEEYRKIRTYRFSVDSHGFTYSKDDKQDPPEKTRVKDRFSDVANRLGPVPSLIRNSLSPQEVFQAKLGTTDSMNDFIGKRACEKRIAQLKEQIFDVLRVCFKTQHIVPAFVT